MKGRLWLNLALLAAVIALALFAWLKPKHSDPEHRLSSLKAADAKTVRIEIAGAAAIVLERAAAGWRITAPIAARADSFQVQGLLGVLEEKSRDRFPAIGLARFELNEPYARLIINQQVFSFGAVNAMSREQYVLTQDGIYLVSPRRAAALPKNAIQLVSRQLFTPDEAPAGFELRDFKVIQQDGKWQVTPAPTEAGADDINRWVDEWRLATALAVQPASGRKALTTIKVKLKDGADVTLAVLQDQPDLVVARDDQKFEYQFTGATARRLLAPPAGQAEGK